MLDICVIILTYNEEMHIKRCIESVLSLTKDIIIVDSMSNDKTETIAIESGAMVYKNKWPGTQAKQFNWALDNIQIKNKWVLRLDADEYLTPELVNEIKLKLPDLAPEVSGVVFKRRYIFLGKWMKKGTYPVKSLRLFKYNYGRCEQRLMDEHIELYRGEAMEFEYDFVDQNLNNLAWWIAKHNGYSIREAIDLLDVEFDLFPKIEKESRLNKQAASKRNRKLKYSRQPLFIRAFLYFIYRYFFRLGILEGKEGFLWHFLQGWWYRTLVDAKIFEIKNVCGNNKAKMKEYILREYELEI